MTPTRLPVDDAAVVDVKGDTGGETTSSGEGLESKLGFLIHD